MVVKPFWGVVVVLRAGPGGLDGLKSKEEMGTKEIQGTRGLRTVSRGSDLRVPL